MTTNNQIGRGMKRLPLPLLGIVGAIGTSIYILQMFQQQGIAACPPITIPTIVPSNVQRSPITVQSITIPTIVPSNVQRSPITVQPIVAPSVVGPSAITIAPACR
ncbi:MAG TPA: hypothetical protein V6D50_12785 [Chroococcales cyanobacterium]